MIPRRNYFSNFFATLFLLFSATTLMAQNYHDGDEDANRDINNFLRYLSHLNRYSPLEGAGSHGSIGSSLGLGVGINPVEHADNSLYEDRLAMPNGEGNRSSLIISKLMLTKGLRWPVDFGFTFGTTQASRISQLGGHIQWTAYERFQMPAVALRGVYARMYGIHNTEFSTYGSEVAISYGFLRYFTAYATYGWQYNTAALQMSAADQSVYFLNETGGGDRRIKENWFSPSQIIGMRVMVVPPFVATTFEMQASSGVPHSYAAKISLGM